MSEAMLNNRATSAGATAGGPALPKKRSHGDVEMRNQEGPHREPAALSMSEQLKKELGYGVDLVVDGSDQAMLDALPQIKKEKIMEERRVKRENLKKRLEFL
jgi:hypothetical protein